MIPCLRPDAPSSLLEVMLSLALTPSQSRGHSSVSPSSIMTPPESASHTIGGMPSNVVDAFNSRVNIMTDAARLAVTMSGLYHTRLSPSRLPPTTIGSSGRIQG